MSGFSIWLSEKGKRYILHPKRFKFCFVNPDIASTIAAVSCTNWQGTFVSPDVKNIEYKGGQTVISLNDGTMYAFDGERWVSK